MSGGEIYCLVESVVIAYITLFFLLITLRRYPREEAKREAFFLSMPFLRDKRITGAASAFLALMFLFRLFEKVLPAFGTH